MCEHVVAQIPHRSLRDIYHQPRVGIGGDDSAQIETGNPQDGMREPGKIRGGLFCQGQDVIVDQRLHKQRSLYICKDGD